MQLKRRIAAVAMAIALAFTTVVVPVNAEKGYDADNTDKWAGLSIITDEVPTDNKDISIDKDGNIVTNTNVNFQLDCVVDSNWTVTPSGQGVTVDASGKVHIAAGATKNQTYEITATPTNITSKGAKATINVIIKSTAAAAKVTDIVYSEDMKEKGVCELSEDQKTITVTGSRELQIQTEIKPAYIENASVEYVVEDAQNAIEVDGDTLYTNEITEEDKDLNCFIGGATDSKKLNVKVVKNKFDIALTSDDVKIDSIDHDANIAMDQKVEFVVAQNSDVALEDYGKISVSNYAIDVKGDDISGSNGNYVISGTNKDGQKVAFGTIKIVNSGSDIKAVVKTKKKNKDNAWTTAKDVTLTLKYSRKDTNKDVAVDSEDSVKLKFVNDDATFNTVSIDFAKGGLEENVDFAVYKETISYKDAKDDKVTKEMPVYYFQADDSVLNLADYTFANGDYSSTVNSFNDDKDRGFLRDDDANYAISYTLTDADVIETQKNDAIGIEGTDVNAQNQLTTTLDRVKKHDVLYKRGIGYKILTVNYSNQSSNAYAIRFVSPSDGVDSKLEIEKNSDSYYGTNETVHLREGESILPQYKDGSDVINATLDDPFLTYASDHEDVALPFTDGEGNYRISGLENGKTTITVKGKVDKSDETTFVVYVNSDAYEYETGSFDVDFSAAQNQKLMNSSQVIDGAQKNVPVNIKVKKAGAGLPADVEWKLMLRDTSDDSYTDLDTRIAEIKEGDVAGSAVITTKLSSNNKIYVRAFSGDKELAHAYFTIGAVKATGIDTIAEQVPTGAEAVVTSGGKNKGVCKTGDAFTLHIATYTPANANEISGSLTWKSEDADVATVDAKTGEVAAVGVGTVDIVATYIADGKESTQTMTLTVEQGEILPTSIVCDSAMTLTRIGAKETIEASILPKNATVQTLTYEVTDGKDVVEVNESGVVTASKVGTATILITATGNKKVTKTVTVTVKGEEDKPETSTTQTPTTTAAPATTQAAPTTQAPAVVKPAKAAIKSLKNKAGKKIVVTIKKLTGATKYQIKYSTKKNMKGAKTVSTTKTSYTLKKLKKGKTYYVQVRGVNTAGKGAWSAKKKIKVKK